MQDSSPFQYIAIDQIFESKTNPRQTFDQAKLEELANSIRHHGLIQPVVVRPKDNGFEIVAGARRFRASQLAEEFSIPAHIKELNDAEAIEWLLVENSQRVDVHPYEEAQGFQRLLDVPGYDVAALVEKSGKSTSHIYALRHSAPARPGLFSSVYKNGREHPLWFLPAPSSRFSSGPPLAGCAAGVKFLLLHLPLVDLISTENGINAAKFMNTYPSFTI